MHPKIWSLIDQSKNILIVSHRKPDGDSVGANCALALYLGEMGKSVTSFCVDPVPENVKFLPQTKKFTDDLSKINLRNFDLIIAVDCGEFRQTGLVEQINKRPRNTFVINIDHHVSNDLFGDIDLVDLEASSTSEIVYTLLAGHGKKLSKEMTNCLLTGIMYDTSFFSNAATTIASVESASELLRNGASIKDVTNNLWKNKTLPILKLWGTVFNRLVFNEEHKVATAVILQEDLHKYNLTPEAATGIANFLTAIYEARFIVLLMQTDDKTVKGSLRTTRDDVDLTELAGHFGGGGHKKASGFTIKGTLQPTATGWQII